jgi:NAD(P)-dependent dehydrogenase (short-subunit alcohol dehydrogenase family)
MQIRDQHVVITGGASGIGRAMAERFARKGARGIVVADLDAEGAQRVAKEVGGVGVGCDVASQDAVEELVATAADAFGAIDLFCSNAGIGIAGGAEVDTESWQRIWDINVMAHVHAARAVLPGMLERGRGYLLNTASAAGLLTQLGSAPYAVTKHAAVAFAEWLAITHAEQGLKVSVLCPQAVRTAMTAGSNDGGVAGVDGMIEPEEVAEAVVRGLETESFLILPHPEVLTYMQRKAGDYERWLGGMQRLQQRFAGALMPDGS